MLETMQKEDERQNRLTERPGIPTLRKGIYAFLDRGIYTLLGVLYILYFARKLPPGEFGLFMLADALRIFTMTFCDTTVGQALIYFGAGKSREIFNDIIIHSSVLKVMLFLFSASIILVCAPFARAVIDYEGVSVLLTTVPVMVFSAMMVNMPSQVLNAQEDYKKLFYYDSFILLAFLVGIGWAERSRFITDAFHAAIFISLVRGIPSFVGCWVIGYPLLQTKLNIRFDTVKMIYSYSRASFLNSLGVLIFTKTDVFLLGIILDPLYVALYSAVAVFINFFRLLNEPFTLMALPAVAKMYHERTNIFRKQVFSFYRKTSLAAFLISLPFTLALFFYPNQIMSIIYGGRYADNAVLVRLFAFWGLTLPFYRTAATIFNGVGRPEMNARFTWIGAATNVFLNVPLIYLMQAVGSALASVATTMILLGLYGVALLKLFTAPAPSSLALEKEPARRG